MLYGGYYYYRHAPPELRWQWVNWKVRGGPQDEYMRAILKRMVKEYRESPNPTIIIGYRGSRKSTVARRCATSLWSAANPFWAHPSSYMKAPSGVVNWSLFAQKHTGYLTVPWRKEAASIAIQQYSAILIAVVSLFYGLLQVNNEIQLTALLTVTVKEMVTSVIGILIAYIFMLFPFKTVLIIDDPLNKKMEENKLPADYAPQQQLDQLMSLSGEYPLIVVTSNEGLMWCVNDRAPGLYRITEMIAPTDEELYFALHGISGKPDPQPGQPGKLISNLRKVTPSLIKKVTALLPEHHGRSMRFWINVHHEIPSMLVDDSRLALSVPTLIRIVEILDLESDATFRVMALVYSPELTTNELQQVRQLVRSSFATATKTPAVTDTAPAPATDVTPAAATDTAPAPATDTAPPRSVFRRVALLWCITQEWEYYQRLAPEDLKAIDEAFKTILETTLNPNKICTLSVTRTHYDFKLSWVFEAVIDAYIKVAEAYSSQNNKQVGVPTTKKTADPLIKDADTSSQAYIDKQVKVLEFIPTVYEKGSTEYIDALFKVAEAYGRLNNIDKQVEKLELIPTVYKKGSFGYINALFKVAEVYGRHNNIDKQVEKLELIPTLYKKGSTEYINALFKVAEVYGRHNNIDKQVEVLELIPTLYDKSTIPYMDATKKIKDSLNKAAEAYGRQKNIQKQLNVLKFIPTLYKEGSVEYINAIKNLDALSTNS